MSHFLARLVQRTRGEISTVRPVLPAVTAPDPTATAWDEQVMVREAAPLAAAPPVARAESHGPPTAALHGSRDDGAEAIGDTSLASAAAEVAVHTPAAFPAPLAALPGALTGTPALRAPPAALHAAQTAPQLTPMPASVEQAHDAPATRVPPSAEVRARIAEVTVAAGPLALRTPSSRPIARAPISTRAALDAHAPTSEAQERPAAPGSIPTAVIPALIVNRTPPQAGPPPGSFSAPLADAAAPRSASPQRFAAHGAPAGLVQETTTTVEVSIGRIEVRLPPRPQAPAGPARPSTRRPVIGLAEYLRARDTGKPQ